MTEHKPMDPATVAAFKAMDRQSVTVRTHELVEDADGAPAGVKATEWAPAYFHVPWGRQGHQSQRHPSSGAWVVRGRWTCRAGPGWAHDCGPAVGAASGRVPCAYSVGQATGLASGLLPRCGRE